MANDDSMSDNAAAGTNATMAQMKATLIALQAQVDALGVAYYPVFSHIRIRIIMKNIRIYPDISG